MLHVYNGSIWRVGNIEKIITCSLESKTDVSLPNHCLTLRGINKLVTYNWSNEWSDRKSITNFGFCTKKVDVMSNSTFDTHRWFIIRTLNFFDQFGHVQIIGKPIIDIKSILSLRRYLNQVILKLYFFLRLSFVTF